MKTWRQGVEVEFTDPAGRVFRARCLKYPLLKVLTEPACELFVAREVLAALNRVGETPLTPEERRRGEGWNYVSEGAGIVGEPPAGVDRTLLVDPAVFRRLDQRLRAASFDASAGRYEAARPGYPAPLWEELERWLAPWPGMKVLEVGAGTGQATVDLLQRWRPDLVCLEPGPHLAARLRTRTGVRVVEARLEEFVTAERFDVLVSATAWHWPPAAHKYRWAHDHLVAGGWLAVFWNTYAVADPALAEALQPLYDRHRIAPSTPQPSAEASRKRFEGRFGEVAASGLFEVVGSRQGGEVLDFPTARFTDLLATFSDHAASPGLEAFLPEVAAEVDARGGVVPVAVGWDLVAARALP